MIVYYGLTLKHLAEKSVKWKVFMERKNNGTAVFFSFITEQNFKTVLIPKNFKTPILKYLTGQNI